MTNLREMRRTAVAIALAVFMAASLTGCPDNGDGTVTRHTVTFNAHGGTPDPRRRRW